MPVDQKNKSAEEYQALSEQQKCDYLAEIFLPRPSSENILSFYADAWYKHDLKTRYAIVCSIHEFRHLCVLYQRKMLSIALFHFIANIFPIGNSLQEQMADMLMTNIAANRTSPLFLEVEVKYTGTVDYGGEIGLFTAMPFYYALNDIRVRQLITYSITKLPVAEQNLNSRFIIRLLELCYSRKIKNQTFEQELTKTLINMVKNTEVLMGKKALTLTEILDYLYSFYIPGIETRLYAVLTKAIGEYCVDHPDFAGYINLKAYSINQTKPTDFFGNLLCGFQSRNKVTNSEPPLELSLQQAPAKKRSLLL